MLIRKTRTITTLLFTHQCKYLSPVDKPLLPLCLNSFTQFSAEIMQASFLHTSGQIGSEVSVLFGGIAFRLLAQAVCIALRGFKFKGEDTKVNYLQRQNMKKQRLILRLIDKFFILDAIRDYQFYGLSTENINKQIHLYLRPSVLFANFANFYLCLNFLRGAHYLLNQSTYSKFCLSTSYLPSLAFYDPYFITPLLPLSLTFAVLYSSRHPFLIHYIHPGNKIHLFNISFMVGLIMVPLPGIYHFAYSGLLVGHLGIMSVRYFIRNLQKQSKKFLQ